MNYIYYSWEQIKEIYELPNGFKNLVLKFVIALAILVIILGCIGFVLQYFIYTPHFNNGNEATFFTGFLNGWFVISNSFLAFLSHLGFTDNQYYIYDFKNHNDSYDFGFAFSIVLFYCLKNLLGFFEKSQS